MILVSMFGRCISYQIIITSLLNFVVGHDEYRIYLAIVTNILILLPMSLKRDMSAFRYVSLASIVALFYTALILLIKLPGYYREYSPSATI